MSTNSTWSSRAAEALLRKLASDRYRACSAGLEPTEVHPMTLRVLDEAGVDAAGLRSKSVTDVLGRSHVRTAVVVCSEAANEACPRLYPFTRQVLQWPFDDPSSVQGSEETRLAAFRRTRDAIETRLRSWLTPLP